VTAVPEASSTAAAGGAADVIALTGATAEIAARGLAVALASVAELAFAGSPWHETPAEAGQMIDRMLGDASLSGFALAIAFAGHGSSMAGFGYGLNRANPHGTARPSSTGAGVFEFCELAVRPACCGRGVGRALHDAVLQASGPRLRWLTTHPAARPAVGLYRSRGWRTAQLYPSNRDGAPRVLMTRPW